MKMNPIGNLVPLEIGYSFYRKFSIEQLIAYFQTCQKILK
jgi:hypothetical protein